MNIEFGGQRTAYTHGGREWTKCSFKPEYIEYLLGYKPKTIFEFGSNDGGDALKYKLAFPESEVYAFEASPRLFTALKQIEEYGVKAFNYAIYNYDGETCFFPTTNKACGNEVGGGSLLKVTESIKESIKTVVFADKPITVPCRTIASLCKEHNITNIDFMHVDVEGVPKEVIEGFGDIKPKVLFIELILTEFSHIGGSKGEEVKQMLADMNYEFIATNENDYLYKLKENTNV